MSTLTDGIPNVVLDTYQKALMKHVMKEKDDRVGDNMLYFYACAWAWEFCSTKERKTVMD